jgi:hypothetical protein
MNKRAELLGMYRNLDDKLFCFRLGFGKVNICMICVSALLLYD